MHTAHLRTERSRGGIKRKQHRGESERIRREEETVYLVRGQLLKGVIEFKYLGKVLDSLDDNWLELFSNLATVSKFWGHFRRIISREGADVRTSGLLCHKIAWALLLYGSKIWVLTAPKFLALEGAHVGFTREVARMKPRRDRRGGWTYPHSADMLRAAGLQTVTTYIGRQQNTVVDWVATRPIMELCLQMGELTGREGGGEQQRRWDQMFPHHRVEVEQAAGGSNSE